MSEANWKRNPNYPEVRQTYWSEICGEPRICQVWDVHDIHHEKPLTIARYRWLHTQYSEVASLEYWFSLGPQGKPRFEKIPTKLWDDKQRVELERRLGQFTNPMLESFAKSLGIQDQLYDVILVHKAVQVIIERKLTSEALFLVDRMGSQPLNAAHDTIAKLRSVLDRSILSKCRFYARLSDCLLNSHDTEEDALKEAQTAFEDYWSDSDGCDGWDSDVEEVEHGILVPLSKVKKRNLKPGEVSAAGYTLELLELREDFLELTGAFSRKEPSK